MGNLNEVEILIVEDNQTDVELALRALKSNGLNNHVYVARDGEEALDFIFCREKFSERDINCRPKFILLDLQLPKVDGLEVLKILKSDSRTKVIPTIVLTTSREQKDVVESYQLGVNSYIVKPVEFDKFVESLEKLGIYWLLLNELPAEL